MGARDGFSLAPAPPRQCDGWECSPALKRGWPSLSAPQAERTPKAPPAPASEQTRGIMRRLIALLQMGCDISVRVFCPSRGDVAGGFSQTCQGSSCGSAGLGSRSPLLPTPHRSGRKNTSLIPWPEPQSRSQPCPPAQDRDEQRGVGGSQLPQPPHGHGPWPNLLGSRASNFVPR